MLKNLDAVAPKLPMTHPECFPKKYPIVGGSDWAGCVLKNPEWWNTLAAFADR